MTDATLVRTTRGVVVFGATLGLAGSVALISGGHAELWWSRFAVHNAAWALLVGIVVWVVIPHQIRNKTVWIMAVSTLSGVYVAGVAVAAALVRTDTVRALGVRLVPADLPPVAAWVLALTVPISTLSFFTFVTLGLLLFPDGRLPSPRWRPVVWLAVVSITATMAGLAWVHRPASLANTGVLSDVGQAAFGVAAVLSLIALVGRFRQSSGQTRQQFKWIAWGATIFGVAVLVTASLDGSRYEDALRPVSLLAGTAMVASLGVALGKYRLYDVDLVISRTVVYGSLAVFITVVYVTTVVGIGQVIGSAQEPNPVLAIAATTVVAVAFEPLRRKLQRVANRIVYGRRATPYEVLSAFTRQIASSDEVLLDRVAQALVEGTTAGSAAVWVRGDGELTRTAVWPQGERALESERVPIAEPLPGVDLVEEVVQDGEVLGVVTLTASRGQALLPSDERLLSQVASGLGMAIQNIRLSYDLRRHVEGLSESRRRLMNAQDETRRNLEREIHDGPARGLIELKTEIAQAGDQATQGGISEVVSLLGDVLAETDQTVEALHDFARGVYPPLLESEGPASAITAWARKIPIPVTVHARGLERHDGQIEAAVYFCVLEALQNVVKHAQATSAHVLLHEHQGMLQFEVSDDGVGYDPAKVATGSGLSNLADRLDALHGELIVESSPGKGTSVIGRIPLQVGVAA